MRRQARKLVQPDRLLQRDRHRRAILRRFAHAYPPAARRPGDEPAQLKQLNILVVFLLAHLFKEPLHVGLDSGYRHKPVLRLLVLEQCWSTCRRHL